MDERMSRLYTLWSSAILWCGARDAFLYTRKDRRAAASAADVYENTKTITPITGRPCSRCRKEAKYCGKEQSPSQLGAKLGQGTRGTSKSSASSS